MEDNLLSAGEFARLARTTKRTVLWYSEKGILRPHITNEAGYRFYLPRQIIDFQVILLLRKLGFSLEEIRAHIGREKSLEDLFMLKKQLIAQEIRTLKRNLRDTQAFYANLAAFGVLVKPEVKGIEAFDIYYLRKTGSYAKIGEYCMELKGAFASMPKDAVYVTVFEEAGYNPKRAQMKIGVIASPTMRLKSGASKVARECLPAYSALVCSYEGSAALLSLLWEELHTYRVQRGFELAGRAGFADLEFYRHSAMNGVTDPDALATELHLPIRPLS